jgi:thioesterase domain-containing protein
MTAAPVRRGLLEGWVLLVAALALACRGPSPEAARASCTHVQSVREVFGTSLCEDAWTCARPPGGPFDRVGLHRLAPCDDVAGAVVLYLPGMHMNGGLRVTEPRYDLRVYLAAEGIRTWGLDYRTHAVPPGASPAQLDALRAWTPEVFLDDAAWAVAFVGGVDRGPLHVAGFSQGAAIAYRLASRPGSALAGLLILDGARSTGRRKDGAVAIDVGGSRLPWAARQRLLTQVLADPGGPSPLPGGGTAGDRLAEILYSAPSFGGNGGLANTRQRVSDLRVLAALLLGYDRWWPGAALAKAPEEPPAAPVPVLAFASTRLGPAWVERVRASAEAWGGRTATVRVLEGYGHLDVLVARRAARDVYAPTLVWLRRGSPQ